MIKPITLLTAAFICLCNFAANAQKLTEQDSIKNLYNTKRAENFYFELLGPGAVYSVNYDWRFAKKQSGWGARAGISYYHSGSEKIFTVPLVLNYLAGKRGKYFEVGGGLTFYNANTNDVFFEQDYDVVNIYGNFYYTNPRSKTGIYGTLNFGYRYQPADGGFNFRAGNSPIITGHEFYPFWPYISFGYTF
ncbi:hypothetical protein FPZ43_13320 [Mucilaginibacter pallidiroseus]|uniref:Outer membrane protein beta-barrel domain-containing protein n=1 Tax=Mucilaginibacter pallidiroseus TaxID=2599295 RepID=A0A563U801_9SPHI|nr:hypothetical protein [Mucilaginibacter pallidiroseus]TWR27453.1 hypothetical protein FPZ43_13320 [Mucilaginibacter pallidiroseus]